MADHSSVPPPPAAHGSAKDGAKKPRAKDAASRLTNFMNFGLLGCALLGWIAWIVLLAGVSAMTSRLHSAGLDGTGDITSLTWVCTWFLFLLLLVFTVLPLIGMTAKMRNVVALANRGALFFLAVLVAWLGVDANQMAKYHRNSELLRFDSQSRVDCVLAGEILALIFLFLMALLLMGTDQLQTHSHKINEKAERRANITSEGVPTPRASGMRHEPVGGHVTGGGPVPAARPADETAVPPYQSGVYTGTTEV